MTKQLFILFIDLYKQFISPIFVLTFGHACRYSPTCSDYAKEAIDTHGVIKGGYLSIRRIISCNPFSRKHFHDPVPSYI